MMLDHIERLCSAYSARRKTLAQKMGKLEQELAKVKARYVNDIKHHAALVAETESELKEAIESSPACFEKPKTKVFHGIKVGFRKGAGKLEWEDDADMVAKLKKRLGEGAEDYIITVEKPSREALKDLDGATLKKLGIAIVDADDQVVVKAVETDIERIVKAIMANVHDEAEEAA